MKQDTYRQEEIRPQLIKYLTVAKATIHLAIGWLADEGLVGLLQKKLLEGVSVEVLLIKDENFSFLQKITKPLNQRGAQIIFLEKSHREQFMDHKFGVIDHSVVLTGNYGWGFKNAPKEDFIKITQALPTLVRGFDIEFEFLCVMDELGSEVQRPNNPILVLLKKMDIVKTLLKIEDVEFIHLRIEEWKKFAADENVHKIQSLLENENYQEALASVENFVEYHQALRERIEPPIENWRREIKLLEEEIALVSTAYNETQKTMQRFSQQHTEQLGDLLQQILLESKLKAEIEARDDEDKAAELEEAKKDHEEYTKAHELAKQQKLKTLSPLEKKEMKKLYRQTSLKCHPDRVVDDLHDQAEELFVELNTAYKSNNLEKVRKIAEQLKSGIMLSKSEGITTLKKLESTYKSLSLKLKDWQEKLELLQQQPTFVTVQEIENWEVYFAERKEILEDQLDRLKAFNEASGANSSSDI